VAVRLLADRGDMAPPLTDAMVINKLQWLT